MKVFAIFAVLLLAPLPSPPKPTPKPDIPASDAHKTEPDHRGTQDSPFVVHIKGTEQSQQETAYNKDKDDREDKRKVYELLLTGVIALSALAQVITAVIQVCIYRKQTLLMRGALQASTKSAHAARDSADDAKETVRLTQCADVLIDMVEMVDAKPLRVDSQLIIHFKNFGPTRAHNVVFDIRLLIPSILDVHSDLSPVVMGSSETKPICFMRLQNLLVLPEQIPAINSGQAPLHFEGIVSYLDVFGTFHKVACSGRFDAPTGSFHASQTVLLPKPKENTDNAT